MIRQKISVCIVAHSPQQNTFVVKYNERQIFQMNKYNFDIHV